MKIPHDPDEIIAVVDDNDNIIGESSRKDVHKNALVHREIGVVLINSKEEVLLQKRKDNGMWDASAGGHFPKDMSYEEAAVKEFEEELGIKICKEDIEEVTKEKISSQTHVNERFVKIFIVKKDISIKDFSIDKKELTEIKYFDKKELKKLLGVSKKTTSTIKFILEKYVINKEI